MGVVKEIILDFDGTIANTHAVILDVANDMAKEYGMEPFTIEHAQEARNLSVREILKRIGINRFQIPKASAKALYYLNQRFDQLIPIEGMEQVLEVLTQDYDLGLVSSNNSELIKRFLKKFNLEYFEYVEGGAALFGKHRKIKTIMRKRGLYKEEVIYIGDEIRDIQAAKKVGIRIISVPWGFNSWEFLEENGADYIAKTPQDIIDYDF